MLGYLFAIISSLFFSFYVVPRKLSTLSPVQFSFLMSLGFFVSSLILFLFQPLIGFHEIWSTTLLWSVVAGIIWATAFVCFVISIDLIGLSRSNQWKNLQGPIAVVGSLLILGEFTTTNPLFALLAACAIFLSALCFTISSGQAKHVVIRGIYLASLSALGFGTVAVIQKYVTSHVGVYSQQVVWSFSIAASLLIYMLLTKQLKNIRNSQKRDVLLGLGAGILYLGASLFQLLSYKYLAASIAFTVIQLNALWTIMIGIFIFREIHFGKFYKRIGLGFLLTLIGILFLVFARK